MALDIQRPEVLVAGMLHQGSKMVVAGDSKSYKTWLLLDLSLSVAAGVPWLGRETAQGPVVFVNFELQDFFFRERMLAVMEAKGITGEQIRESFYYVGMRGISASNQNLVETLEARLEGVSPRMLTLDPLYKMHGDRDENSAGDMADLMSYLDRLARNTNAAVVFGHHFSKGSQAGKDMRDRGAGSGVITRDADTIMTVTRHAEDDAFAIDCVPRNFPPVESFGVRRSHPLMVVDETLDASHLRQPSRGPGREQVVPDIELLAIITEAPATKAQWTRAAMQQLGMTKTTAYRRIDDLASEGAVELRGGLFHRVERPQNPVRQAMSRRA